MFLNVRVYEPGQLVHLISLEFFVLIYKTRRLTVSYLVIINLAIFLICFTTSGFTLYTLPTFWKIIRSKLYMLLKNVLKWWIILCTYFPSLCLFAKIGNKMKALFFSVFPLLVVELACFCICVELFSFCPLTVHCLGNYRNHGIVSWVIEDYRWFG